VSIQRSRYNKDKLSTERIQRLEAIGLIWNPLEAAWEEGYQHLVAYKAEYGDCNVPDSYSTKDGFKLGVWVSVQRQNRRGRKNRNNLPAERIQRLEAIGFIWTTSGRKWEEGYQRLVAYKAEYGDCNVSSRYRTKDSFKLGSWVSNQRKDYNKDKLSTERIQRLEAIGFVWDILEAAWEEGYQHLVAYKAEYGDCNVPDSYSTKDGFKLGGWVSNQRSRYNKDKLSTERIQRLEAIGLIWNPFEVGWEEGYQHLVAYKAEYGDCNVSALYSTKDGFKLGGWVSNQRKNYTSGAISDERIKRLEAIGFVWRRQLKGL
jgi:hypothetical protein